MHKEEILLYLSSLSEEADRLLQPTQEHVFSKSFERKQEAILAEMMSHEDSEKNEEQDVGLKKERGCGSGKKWAVVLLVAVLAVGGTIFASESHIVQVRELFVNEEVNEPIEEAETYVDETGVEQEVTMISCDNPIYLTCPDTPEALASQEWLQFMEEHEQTEEYNEAVRLADEKWHQLTEEWYAAGKGDPVQLENPKILADDLEAYEQYTKAYGAIDHTMAQKLDELQEKYDVKLLTGFQDLTDYDYDKMAYRNCYGDVLEHFGLKSFLTDPESVEFAMSYAYEDVYLHADIIIKGSTGFGGHVGVIYRGYLNPIGINLGDTGNAEEWTYVNKSGNEVTLYLMRRDDGDNILLFYEGAEAFVYTGNLGVRDATREMAEDFADLFDLSVF